MADKTAEQLAAEQAVIEAAARQANEKAVAEATAAAAKEAAITAAKEKLAVDTALTAGKKRKPFTIVGRPGYPFNIDGEGFRVEKKGILLIGGRVVETTKWNDVVIKGQMPVDIKLNAVVSITRGDGSEIQTGVYKV